MITHIQLKFGSVPGSSAQLIPTTPITIFVGPNNSGKSLVLNEIHHRVTAGPKADDIILQDLTFEPISSSEAASILDLLRTPPNSNEHLSPEHVILSSYRGGRMLVSESEFVKKLQEPTPNAAIFAQWFLRHFTLKLDGPNRVKLVNSQPGGDLQRPPATSLQMLFKDDNKRSEVRRILHDAFDAYFVIDPTNLGHLRIRLSPRAPIDNNEERNIHAEGVEFHSRALPIEQTSDGVKAFTGIIAEVVAGDNRVLLIDEPEAFLHPSLATKLGYELARTTSGSKKNIFVSTHSPQFVMGCVQSGVPINIIRLTYRNNVATARLLPSGEILQLMRNPLLRSIGVLNGLFYENVVVTESDADRAFYQEINERLLHSDPSRGIPNCLFLNSQGKHTLQTIMQPLRKLGIPTAGIVDVDVLKDTGAQWAGILDGANLPQTLRQSLAALRSAVKAEIDRTGLNMKRDGGISVLDDGPLEAAKSLFGQLGDYGIFVVPGGELESWLKSFGARGHGPPWLIDIFGKIGDDPTSPGYVVPLSGDVWDFLSQVAKWLLDPKRLGIPR